MLISDMWKNSVKEIINMVWKDKIPADILETHLNTIIKNHERAFPAIEMRNIYTNNGLKIPLNELLNIIQKENLCIEGNNTLTYSYERIKTPLPDIIIDLNAERSRHKKKAKELAEEIYELKKKREITEGSDIEIRRQSEEALQNAQKMVINSIYGVQGQDGSILYSPDTAGAVTSQGRSLISEMMWSIERMLYGTVRFSSFSEFFCFLYTITTEVHIDSPLFQYITYWPTKRDIKRKLISLLYDIPNLYTGLSNIELTLYHFINNLTALERVYLYYKCDLMKLIVQNPKIFKLFYDLFQDPDSYNSTSERDTPPHYIPILNQIAEIVEEFVIVKMTTPNRIIKYGTRRRRGIILSDTDSIVINLHPYVKKLSELFYTRQGYDISMCNHLAFNNERLCFKIVNIMSYLCVHVTKIAAQLFCKSGNVPKDFYKYISMKNEFYFMRMVIYINAMKNYICYVRLNEGKHQDEITATGIKLNSSTSNPQVKDAIMRIIEHQILKSETINPASVLRSVKQIEQDIITRTMQGDITFGKRGRYSGPHGYKTVKRKIKKENEKNKNEVPGIYTSSVGRSCYIWNLLYPASKINVGDYAYIFDTTLESLYDLEKMKIKFPHEYDEIKRIIFENANEPYLARYGLRSIAIPMTDTVHSIPPWIIDFIDYENLTNKHLQPIISLLPSIGIHKSRISSTKSTYSPLISF
jgi:hypothetical protein